MKYSASFVWENDDLGMYRMRRLIRDEEFGRKF